MSDGTSTPSAEHRLAQLARLRDLWLENRSTRQFVQIAEELRRLGDAESAAALLEVGLESHPRYLSAQVALARCRVELGQAEAARGLLESVVEIDSTHPLATRLLVEAYLGVGDAAAAREKLELYRLLNAGDPQIERLEEGVQALEGTPAAAQATEVAEAGATSATAVAEPTGPAEAAVQTSDGVEEVEGGRRESSPMARAGSGPAEPGAGGSRRGLAPPFVLEADGVARTGEWSRPRGLTAPFLWSPGRGGVTTAAGSSERGLEPPFQLAPGASAVEPVSGDAPSEAVSPAPVLLEEPSAGAGPADESVFEAGDLRAAMEEEVEAWPSVAPAVQTIAGPAPEMVAEAPPVAVGLESAEADQVAEVLGETEVAEAVDAAVGDVGPEDSSLGTDLAAEQGSVPPDEAAEPLAEWGEQQPILVAGAAEVEPMIEAPPTMEDSGALPLVAVSAGPTVGPLAAGEGVGAASPSSLPAETTTLGQLYLRQGHSAEAERIFRRVLDREPANDTAREGLRQAMIATDLARAGAAAPPRGITERKIHRLTGWVSRLRRT